MTSNVDDRKVLRELARQYADIAAKPVQKERRDLWSAHNALQETRPLVLATYGMWNVWCRELFGDEQMSCGDPFYRDYERWLRMEIFHDSVGDDYIVEPWIPVQAVFKLPSGLAGETWGVSVKRNLSTMEGGSWKSVPPLADWSDMVKLRPPVHVVDEKATSSRVERLQEAVGDIVEVDLCRGPQLRGFGADISTTLAYLRGLEQIMLDMYEAPEELHALLAFMRDGILADQDDAEEAGDISLTSQINNQTMSYADNLERPRANSGPRQRKEIWTFMAAQEYTLISPAFHEEFLLRYQLPIMEKYALVHYGCCEDLTRKIDMLRQVPNLRSIAVTPVADIRSCAEQIGSDYVLSWRPSPAEMVCTGWNEEKVSRLLSQGLYSCRDNHCHIHLNDIETLQKDYDRLRRWTELALKAAGA